jgi:WD40 repeat protein
VRPRAESKGLVSRGLAQVWAARFVRILAVAVTALIMLLPIQSAFPTGTLTLTVTPTTVVQGQQITFSGTESPPSSGSVIDIYVYDGSTCSGIAWWAAWKPEDNSGNYQTTVTVDPYSTPAGQHSAQSEDPTTGTLSGCVSFTVSYVTVAGSSNGWVNVWATSSSKPTWYRNTCGGGVPCSVTSVAASADGSLLAAGSDNGWVNVWGSSSSTPQGYYHAGGSKLVLTFSADGSTLVSGGDNGYVNLFKSPYGPLKPSSYYNAGGAINSVSSSSNGQVLASGSSNGYVNIYNLTGTVHLSPSKSYNTNAPVLSVAVSVDGNVVAAGSSNGYLNVFIWTGSAWVARCYNTNGGVNAVAVSHGPSNVILAGSANGYVNKFHRSGTSLTRDWYYNTNAPVLSVSVANNAPDYGGGAAGSSNGYVNYWNNAALMGSSGKPTWYCNTNAAVNAISISASGLTMAAGSQNGYVNVWYVSVGSKPDGYYYTNGAVMSVDVSGV